MAEARASRFRWWKAILYPLFLASWFIVVVIFYIIPSLKGIITKALADNDFQFATNYPPAKLSWSIDPPSVTISSIHVETRNISANPPYIIEVHLDSIQYRVETARFWRRKHSDAPPSLTRITSPPNSFMTSFATISWNNLTVLAHEPHPQPRLSILDGRIRLSSLSIRQQMRKLWAPRENAPVPCGQSTLLQLSIAKIGVTTHSITSIPLPIIHPTTRRLIDRFPTFFNLFTTPASVSDNEYPLIYPPHLSFIAPSLVFPALYQGISSFSRGSKPEGPRESDHHTYNFPTPFPHAIIQANFTRIGARRMHQVSLALIDQSDNPRQCTPIHIGSIKSVELSGRDTDGKGGCCTFQARDLGNMPTPSIRSNSIPSAPSPAVLRSLLDPLLNSLIGIFECVVTPIAHSYHLATFVVYFKMPIQDGNRLDLCALREMMQYRIDSFQWIDQTPKTMATVARALAEVHNGFLNLFEGALGLVV